MYNSPLWVQVAPSMFLYISSQEVFAVFGPPKWWIFRPKTIKNAVFRVFWVFWPLFFRHFWRNWAKMVFLGVVDPLFFVFFDEKCCFFVFFRIPEVDFSSILTKNAVFSCFSGFWGSIFRLFWRKMLFFPHFGVGFSSILTKNAVFCCFWLKNDDFLPVGCRFRVKSSFLSFFCRFFVFWGVRTPILGVPGPTRGGVPPRIGRPSQFSIGISHLISGFPGVPRGCGPKSMIFPLISIGISKIIIFGPPDPIFGGSGPLFGSFFDDFGPPFPLIYIGFWGPKWSIFGVFWWFLTPFLRLFILDLGVKTIKNRGLKPLISIGIEGIHCPLLVRL